MNPDPPGILEQLRARARMPGDAVVGDALRWSHGELHDRVAAAAERLAALGVGPGRAVGVAIADEARHLVATLALLARGAGQVVLASHDAPSVRDALAQRIGVRLVVDEAVDLGGAPPARPLADRSAEARIYLKTSGTTGDVNIVACPYAGLVAQAARHPEYANERLLRLAAIEHNNSKRHRLSCVLQGGTNVFAAPRPSVFDCVRRHAVTCLDISRLHAADLAALGEPLPASVKLRTGGSAIPAALRRRLVERVTPRLYVRYAATECGAIAMAGPADHEPGVEVAGRPLAGVEVQIVDVEGRLLPAGASGRIRIRAPGMATGYHDHAEQSATRFRDGWFWPGDVGLLREDGQLVVQGRGDDMIILNGLNIFPAEIEQVLEQHPAVAEAAAFPLASGVHGQIPVAAVAWKLGAATSAGELQAYARERLGLRSPRRILVLDELPRNSQGKVSRRALHDALLAGLAPAPGRPPS